MYNMRKTRFVIDCDDDFEAKFHNDIHYILEILEYYISDHF